MPRLVCWRNGFWLLLAVSVAVIGRLVVEAGDRDAALRASRTEAEQYRKFLTLLRAITLDTAQPRTREEFLALMQREYPREFPALLADGSVYVGGLEFVFEDGRMVAVRD
jgi:hypothetical protein